MKPSETKKRLSFGTLCACLAIYIKITSIYKQDSVKSNKI